MENAAKYIPLQETGRETNFTHECELVDVKTAHTVFKQAVERLLNVDNWHEYAGAGSAKFTLCNQSGNATSKPATKGFYINIDLPMPGPDAGNGLEWVIIENLMADGNEYTPEEYLLFTARPVPDPKKSDRAIAHFFNDKSTSTFIIRRTGHIVTAGVHGRNESPNNTDVDLHDKIRNTTIALLARLGLSGGQWQKLVNGLIDGKN